MSTHDDQMQEVMKWSQAEFQVACDYQREAQIAERDGGSREEVNTKVRLAELSLSMIQIMADYHSYLFTDYGVNPQFNDQGDHVGNTGPSQGAYGREEYPMGLHPQDNIPRRQGLVSYVGNARFITIGDEQYPEELILEFQRAMPGDLSLEQVVRLLNSDPEAIKQARQGYNPASGGSFTVRGKRYSARQLDYFRQGFPEQYRTSQEWLTNIGSMVEYLNTDADAAGVLARRLADGLAPDGSPYEEMGG